MTTRWNCKVIDVKPENTLMTLNAEDMQEILNQHGMQGWELMDVARLAMNRASLYFKKPK